MSILNNLSLLNFPIGRRSLFHILGMFGGIFHFYSIFDRFFFYSSSGDPDQTPHSAVSYLGFHCLSRSHRKDARLIWVNMKISDSSKILNIEMRISKWYFDIQNCTFKVNFDTENMIFCNIPNAKVGF